MVSSPDEGKLLKDHCLPCGMAHFHTLKCENACCLLLVCNISPFSVRLIQKDLPKFVHIIYKPKDYGKENCHILYAYALCH